MNINVLLNRIKTETGLGSFLKTQLRDSEIISKIVLPITLPDFSKVFKHRMLLPGVTLVRDNKRSNIYSIPVPDIVKEAMRQYGVELKGLASIERSTGYLNGIASDHFEQVPGIAGDLRSMNTLYNEGRMAYAYEAHSLNETMSFGHGCEFIHPFSLRMLDPNINYSQVKFDLNLYCTHPHNLSTINNNIEKAFVDLAVLDVKRILWHNEMKYINGIETKFNSVNLQIDEWREADTARKDLMEEYEDMAININPTVVT